MKNIKISKELNPNLGIRRQMEDYVIAEDDLLGDGRFSLYAVLDGHGGQEVAKFA